MTDDDARAQVMVTTNSAIISNLESQYGIRRSG